MPHTIQRLSNEPIILVTYEEPFDYALGFEEIKKAVASTAEGIEGQVYDIHDVRQLRLNFSKVVTALANALLNPILKGRTTTIGVGTGMLFDLATKAAGQKQYGTLNVLIFPTVEEAVNYVHEHLKKSS
jgi:hypothetical protein